MQLTSDPKVRARKLLAKKHEAWTRLLEKGADISDSRMTKLQELRDDASSREPSPDVVGEEEEPGLGRVFAINLQSKLLDSKPNVFFFELRRGTAESDEGADYEQLRRTLKQEVKDYRAQGLVVEIEEFVNDFDRALLSCATMLCLPVVVLCSDLGLHDSINKATGSVWHICSDEDALLQYLNNDMPRLIAIVKAIANDVEARVEKYKRINKIKHGLKRGAVALVPGGVFAVNFLGIVRLVRRLLRRTGMLSDREAKKASAIEAAVTGFKVALIEGVGDVYHFAISATVLAGMTSHLSVAGLEAGLASLSTLDFALLGSITVVTGTVSAIAAYISRPAMVKAIASLITIMQVVCLLNPALRRKDGGLAATTHDEGMADLELQPSARMAHCKPWPLITPPSGGLAVPAAGGDGGQQVDSDTDLADLVDSDSEEVDLDTETQPLLDGDREAAPAPAASSAAAAALGDARLWWWQHRQH